jgi:hypothetical protein
VTVDEVVTGVSIALDIVSLERCEAMDLDGSGSVTVDELLRAINAALNGCRRRFPK